MKEYKKAIKDFNRAISLNPGVGDYYFNRSLSYFFLEQYKKAYQDLQRGKRAGAKPNPRYVKLLNKRLKHKSEN